MCLISIQRVGIGHKKMWTSPGEHQHRGKFSWLIKVYIVHNDVIKWIHFPRYWPFVRGIQRLPVNSPHKGQWHGALMFSLICAWINRWVNNREAGDLRRHCTHCDVIVMIQRVVLSNLITPDLYACTWLDDVSSISKNYGLPVSQSVLPWGIYPNRAQRRKALIGFILNFVGKIIMGLTRPDELFVTLCWSSAVSRRLIIWLDRGFHSAVPCFAKYSNQWVQPMQNFTSALGALVFIWVYMSQSVNSGIIGSGNGLSLVRHQAITSNNTD